jgi:hypothetical protein
VSSDRPGDRETVEQMMVDWQTEAGLGAVPDAGGLARLPEAEQQEWRDFWRDVKMLLARARETPRPGPGGPR